MGKQDADAVFAEIRRDLPKTRKYWRKRGGNLYFMLKAGTFGSRNGDLFSVRKSLLEMVKPGGVVVVDSPEGRFTVPSHPRFVRGLGRNWIRWR